MQNKPIFTRKQLIIIITSIAIALAVIIGGVIWLAKDSDDVTLPNGSNGSNNPDIGDTPWDDF